MTRPDSALISEALELTQRWCAIPSVKGNDADIVTQAAAIVEWLVEETGADIITSVDAKGRAPLIHARIDIGAPRTVILYNMYDVMPATPEGWSVDPFKGGVVDLDGIGECFVARGAENNKGPLAGMLVALRALLRAGALKVNVEILVEGEEETGSGALRDYLLADDCPLRRSDAAIFPSFCEYGGGPPRLYLGFSGIARGTIRVAGGEWGGPRAAIHSSNAPWIANPASRLVQALAVFGKPPTGELDRIEIDAEAAELIAGLARNFDPQAELRYRHTQRYALEGDPETLLRHVLSTVSLNIASLSTDPPAGSAIIPASASAGFDLRTPPSIDPADCLDCFRASMKLNGCEGVELIAGDCYPGYRFAADAPGVTSLLAAYARTAEKPVQIWPWAIGAAPAYAFARHTGSFLIAGSGRGGNAHGIDEFMTLEGFGRFMESISLWLGDIAAEVDG